MYKIIILGVGNSGTRLLGNLVSRMLQKDHCPNYYYEPLYWKSVSGEQDIVLSDEAIEEHKSFPLLPEEHTSWPWLDEFVASMNGVAKFIRAGSRVSCFPQNVKIIWIVRELYSYLGSMQKNFPRCSPDAGWHHRPGKYDDFERIQALYPEFSFSSKEQERIVVESAWWHLHNARLHQYASENNVFFLSYEALCNNPVDHLRRLSNWAGIPALNDDEIPQMRSVLRNVNLTKKQFDSIEAIAGSLNRELYNNEVSEPRIVSESL